MYNNFELHKVKITDNYNLIGLRKNNINMGVYATFIKNELSQEDFLFIQNLKPGPNGQVKLSVFGESNLRESFIYELKKLGWKTTDYNFDILIKKQG